MLKTRGEHGSQIYFGRDLILHHEVAINQQDHFRLCCRPGTYALKRRNCSFDYCISRLLCSEFLLFPVFRRQSCQDLGEIGDGLGMTCGVVGLGVPLSPDTTPKAAEHGRARQFPASRSCFPGPSQRENLMASGPVVALSTHLLF